MNTDFDRYLLADQNTDLINLYQQLQTEGDEFIDYCKTFFIADNNTEEQYYALRDKFNRTRNISLRSALFLYLNRHCYNGLCRYNSKGIFNTPFGRYTKPYFPKKEMQYFYEKSGRAEFIRGNFIKTMNAVKQGDVVYCDPPYTPLSKTSYFTDYYRGGFSWEDQVELSNQAHKLSRKGIKVIISNHNTAPTRELYREAGAKMERFQVRRSISCDPGNRTKVGELLAIFG